MPSIGSTPLIGRRPSPPLGATPAFAAKPTTHPISPVRFIRERCFEGYGPPSTVAEAASVFVRLDTPQWRAWTAYRGRPIPLNREGTGWHFPSEWPPTAERGAA